MKGYYYFRVEFEDFFSKNSIRNVQDGFLADDCVLFSIAPDMKFNYNSVLTLVPQYNNGQEGDYILKDVLIYNSSKIAERYIEDFKKVLDENKFLNNEMVLDFALNKLSKLPDVPTKLEQVDYELLPELKEILIEQYFIIKDFLDEKQYNPTILLNKKINFKLNKTDVIALFFFLRQNGLIERNTDAELGSLIDAYFTFSDGDSEKPKVFKRSRTFLSDINTGNKTIKKSVQRLKNKFLDESFYVIKT